MPTYDYECISCGYQFEQFQSMSDEALTDCPQCSKSKLRRLIGNGMGIIFKGSGFYVNDARKSDSSEKSEKLTPTAAENKKTKSPGTNKKASA